MSTRAKTSGVKRWTASELRKLPPEQRDAILAAAAARAEQEYRTNPELTAFEAFGKDDLHGESASSETR
jgi:acyl-CoA reductase-like NAD-dependent aldehyde dehydrogenase